MQTCTAEVLSGPDAGRAARIDKPIYRIGSHESNDLVLADDAVSKHPLEITTGPEGYKITDLSSSNGTFLGGIKIGEISVVEPVTQSLGTTTLKIAPAAV